VSGIWTADPARLSMAAACPDFFQMERRFGSLWAGERARLRTGGGESAAGARYGQFVTLSSGMQTLPDALARWLEQQGVRFVTATVTGLHRSGDETGRWSVACDREPALEADGIVMAAPAPVAASLLGAVDRTLAEALAGIDYAGSAVVSLGYARADVAHPLDAAGVVVPRCEGRRILAISFSSSKFPGRAPAGHVLVRVFVGGALDPEAALLDDERLVTLVRQEAADVIGARGAPCLVQIDRWTRAMPQYHVGHRQRLALIRGRLDTLPGLALAGAAYEGVGIPQVIASGQVAATRVIRVLDARPPG
jgi:oxygen-dependent protoporphyrinogen oxidase